MRKVYNQLKINTVISQYMEQKLEFYGIKGKFLNLINPSSREDTKKYLSTNIQLPRMPLQSG